MVVVVGTAMVKVMVVVIVAAAVVMSFGMVESFLRFLLDWGAGRIGQNPFLRQNRVTGRRFETKLAELPELRRWRRR